MSRKTLNGHTPLHMLAASPRLESSLKEQSSVQLFQEVKTDFFFDFLSPLSDIVSSSFLGSPFIC